MAIALVQFAVQKNPGVGGTLTSPTLGAAPTAGNLLVSTASARWGASGPVGTWTDPAGWSPGFTIAPMEAHNATLAYKVSNGTETTVAWSATGTTSPNHIGLYEYSGITTPALDKTSVSGTGATNATSAATGSTGTLGATSGLAFVIGLSRTAAAANTFTVDSGFTETFDDGSNNGSVGYNEVHAWLEFAASTALNVTTSSSGSTRRGAGIVTFIASGGGGGATYPPSPVQRQRLNALLAS